MICPPERLLGDGSQFGCDISYAVQDAPRGLAEAFLIGDSFIGSETVALVLGDNLFHGGGFSRILMDARPMEPAAMFSGSGSRMPPGTASRRSMLTAGSCRSRKNPNTRNPTSLSSVSIFDNRVVDIARHVTPSARGELEITEVIKAYNEDGSLRLDILPRGLTWLDTGTHESMMQASQYVYAVEERSGVKIACLEEIALNKGWIDVADIHAAADRMGNGSYSRYLKRLRDEHH